MNPDCEAENDDDSDDDSDDEKEGNEEEQMCRGKYGAATFMKVSSLLTAAAGIITFVY